MVGMNERATLTNRRFGSWRFVLVAMAGVVFLGCAKDKGPAFVFDGLYLEYTVGEDDTCRLEFTKVGDDLFLMKRDPEDCGVKPDGMAGGEMRVTGRLESEDGKRLNWGEYINLWIPPDVRKVGTHTIYGGREEVIAVEQWQDWQVAIVHGKIALLEGKWYYDVKTGFLVGFERTFAGESHLILHLTDTNAGE